MKIIIEEVNNLPDNTLFNLRWLIPMVFDEDLIRPVQVYDKSKRDGLEKIITWED